MGTITTIHPGMRELDRRSNGGIVVALLWNPTTNQLVVTVWSELDGDWFEIAVEADEALDVFHHPYAYADRARTGYAVLV